MIARRALCALVGALLPASAAHAQEPQLTPPMLMEDVAATIPAELVVAGEVTARLRVEIAADGSVAQAALVSLEPEPAPEHRAQLEALVLTAARVLRFSPATRDGTPLHVTIGLELTLSPASPSRAATLAALTTTSAGEVATAALAVAAAPRSGGRTATRRRREEGASDLYIKVGALREVPRTSAEQLLTLAPGVSLSNHGGEGHPSAVFMRGFNAGEGQDIAFSVMGAPLNDPSNPHGHGFADTHFLIPELVQAVRVVEGPFDPRQGDFAVAGSVDFELGSPSPGLTVLAAAGQFGTRRLGLLIADEANHAIRQLDLTTREVTTVIGALGVSGGTGLDVTPLADVRLYFTSGVALAGDTVYLTADVALMRVARLLAPTTP